MKLKLLNYYSFLVLDPFYLLISLYMKAILSVKCLLFFVEADLIDSLPLDSQCSESEASLIRFLYGSQLKKVKTLIPLNQQTN